MNKEKDRIEKIGDDYFINSILHEVIVEKKLEKPLPVEMIENTCLLKEPLCCLCGIWGERRDVVILCIDGDWKKWICNNCVEKYMPDLYEELRKRIKKIISRKNRFNR